MKTATTKKKDVKEADLLIRLVPLDDLLPNPYQPASRGERLATGPSSM